VIFSYIVRDRFRGFGSTMGSQSCLFLYVLAWLIQRVRTTVQPVITEKEYITERYLHSKSKI